MSIDPLLNYIKELRKDGVWADNITLQAMADYLDINIGIFHTLNHELKGEHTKHGTVTLGLIKEEHYVSIVDDPPFFLLAFLPIIICQACLYLRT